jgi:hypothetical protein
MVSIACRMVRVVGFNRGPSILVAMASPNPPRLVMMGRQSLAAACRSDIPQTDRRSIAQASAEENLARASWRKNYLDSFALCLATRELKMLPH